MTEFMEKQLPILVGDVATAAHPVRRLYDEKKPHERTQPRFMWPVQAADSSVSHDLFSKIDSIARPLWVEMGFGPGTSLSHVTPYKVRKILTYDDRAWVSNLMSFSHNPKTFGLYRALVKHYDDLGGPDVHDLINLRRIADPLDRWDRAGIALYLLAMSGGRADYGTTAAAAIPATIACGPIAESKYSSCFPLCPVQTVADLTEVTLNLIKMMKPMRRSVHFSLNRIPSGNQFRKVVDALTRHEMSWSASFLADEVESRSDDLVGGRIFESGHILHVLPC